MNFHQRMAATATRLLNSDMAADAVITRPTGGFDPITGKKLADSETLNCRAVAKPVKIKNDRGLETVATGLTMSVAPLIGDIVTMGALSATVIEVSAIGADGVPIVWNAVAV